MYGLSFTFPFSGQAARRMKLEINDPSVGGWVLGALVTSLLCSGCDANRSEDTVSCFGGRDVILTNGSILTMDADDSVVSSVRIRDDRIVGVGDVGSLNEPCVEVVDLSGRTVTPGLIDSHVHFVRGAQAPGHFLSAVETAFSIDELLDRLRERAAALPSGELISVIGGMGVRQFSEKRLPRLEELDAAAVDHPVYLQQGFTGPAVTNSLGKELFEARGISVEPDGRMVGPAVAEALETLILDEEPDDTRRSAIEYMAYASSVGLTTVVDQGCCTWFGVRLPPDRIPGYETFYDLWRQDELTLRLRLQYMSMAMPDESGRLPVETRMEHSIMGIGDSKLKVVGVGEFVVGAMGVPVDRVPYDAAYRAAAVRGWGVSQHSGTPEEHAAQLAAFESVASDEPIGELRWSLEHVFNITGEQLTRLAATGAGVRVQNQEYLRIGSLPAEAGGPPFRTILDSGIRVGAGTDASGVTPLSPWTAIYYIVTGKNASGELVNQGEQLTRLEALRLYTTGSAWFSFDERALGSIEEGKLADLVVLSDDFLAVPDEELRTLRSVLTLVGGQAVHATDEFQPLLGR